MPRLVDSQTLEYVDVPEDQAAAAIASGQYGFDPNQTISVVSRDGQRFDLGGAEAVQALAEGFRLEGDSEQNQRVLEEQYGDQDVRAFLEGAGRGLTFGISDQIQRAAGVSPEDLAGRKDANPNAAFGGEIIGAAAPILASGGAGAVGTAARTAGAGVRGAAAAGAATEAVAARALTGIASRGAMSRALTTAASRGAGSAVEGALFGAGQVISEDALGKTELTAENLAAGVGMGALIGGAAGGVFGLGEVAVGSAVKASSSAVRRSLELAGDESVGEIAGRLANTAARRSLGATKSSLKKVARGPRYKGDVAKVDREVGDFLRQNMDELDGRAILGNTVEETAENIEAVLATHGDRIGAAVGRLDELSQGAVGVSGKEIADALAAKLDDETLRAAGGFAGRRTNALSREIDNARSLGDEAMSFADAHRLKRFLDEEARFASASQSDKVEAVREAAFAVRNLIRDKAEQVSKDVAEELADANRIFSLAKDAETLALDGVERFAGNRVLSLTDNIQSAGGLAAGLATGSLPVGLVSGAGLGVANNLIRKRGMSAAAKVLTRIERASQKSTRRIDKAVARITKTASKTRTAGVKAAATRSYKAAKDQTGNVVGGEIAADATRARRTAAPASLDVLERVNFGDDKKKSKSKLESYDRRVTEIADLAANPEKLQARLSKNLDAVTNAAPKIGAHLAMTATKATQFLASKAPKKEMFPGVVAGQVEGLGPSSLEMAEFERYVEAVEDPVSVIESVGEGTVTDEGVEVLKTVYPEMYATVVERLLQDYDKIQLLPYEQRLNLSILFDQPFDYSMESGLVSAVQASYAATEESQDEPDAGMVRPTAGALKELSFADKAKTQTERILSE
ncbi:MAG: hypothetical protein AAF654_14810 [Myxococcota bacterium]